MTLKIKYRLPSIISCTHKTRNQVQIYFLKRNGNKDHCIRCFYSKTSERYIKFKNFKLQLNSLTNKNIFKHGIVFNVIHEYFFLSAKQYCFVICNASFKAAGEVCWIINCYATNMERLFHDISEVLWCFETIDKKNATRP